MCNNIFLSQASFIIRIQYIIHSIYKICVYQVFLSSVRILLNRRVLAVRFGGVKSSTQIFNCAGNQRP